MRFLTKSKNETQKIAKTLAGTIIRRRKADGKRSATVLALEGNLGAGKTAFVQGLARGFGIATVPRSPTFILMQIYSIPRTSLYLAHLDVYRLERPKDLVPLGFKQLLKDPAAIVVVEWAEKIRKLLPKDTVWVKFKHAGKNKRVLDLKI